MKPKDQTQQQGQRQQGQQQECPQPEQQPEQQATTGAQQYYPTSKEEALAARMLVLMEMRRDMQKVGGWGWVGLGGGAA